MIAERNILLKQLPAFQDVRILVKQFQQTKDIVRLITKAHADYEQYYDMICDRFWRETPEDTARCLYAFCKRNIRYVVEPEKRQTVMSPMGILYNGRGDCKHYASFINGVLDALRRKGYPVSSSYRFASYDPMEKNPGHVFAVLNTKRGEVFVDPVLPTFNNRKFYFYHTDKPLPMSLYQISGMPDTDEMGKIKLKDRLKNRGKLFLKVSLAASRNSFGLLVKLNTFRLATKMYAAIKAGKGDAIKKKWESIGGNWKKLETWIHQGVNTYNKLHKKKKISGLNDEYIGYTEGDGIAGIEEGVYGFYEHPETGNIGVVQFAAAAAILAAATPVIKMLASLLKSLGINTKGKEDQAAAAVAEGVAEQAAGGGAIAAQQAAAIEASGMTVQRTNVRPSANDDGVNMEMSPAESGGDVGVPKANTKSVIEDTFQKVKDFASTHKKEIYWGVGIFIGVKYVLPMITNAIPQGRRPRRK